MHKVARQGVDLQQEQQCYKCRPSGESQAYQCLVCTKVCGTKGGLRVHIKQHTVKERTLQCSQCKDNYIFLDKKRFVRSATEEARNKEKPIEKASRVLREFMPGPLLQSE